MRKIQKFQRILKNADAESPGAQRHLVNGFPRTCQGGDCKQLELGCHPSDCFVDKSVCCE